MTLHLHDYARALNDERITTTHHAPDEIEHGATPRRLRTVIGNALIRAGTMLLPRPVERPPRVQTIPPC